MDYVVGSVAALISGNVTPNRPRLTKRALTPTKHQPSPNVTPKSEFVDDRSIFQSPTTQKKKAIIKKSPKRIFENPDLEASDSNEGISTVTSPKAEKVKKHLQEELEEENTLSNSLSTTKQSKNKSKNTQDSASSQDNSVNQEKNENTPKKKKRKHNSESQVPETPNTPPTDIEKSEKNITPSKKSKKLKKKLESITDESNKENDNIIKDVINPETAETSTSDLPKTNETTKKKNKKRKKKNKAQNIQSTENKQQNDEIKENQQSPKKKNKKRKKSKLNIPENNDTETKNTDNNEKPKTDYENGNLNSINPNAITEKDSDSEHDSDDEIDSENEQINKKVFKEGLPESSDEEEEKEEPKEKVINKEVVKKDKEVNVERITEEEVKRTLFVGNVPFSKKCKKEIKKIFSKHGQIETVRIRTVPIKDGRFTPKLAVIKNELHPERTTVNVYVKFADADSVDKALSENNTVLNEHHLRVSRSSSTGSEHDPRNSVFIGNLPFAMEDEVLRTKFEKCGEIESVRIIRDKKTNAGKGFGYVNFKSKDGVELALALSEEDLTVKNRILRVKRCTQLTNKHKSPKPVNNRQKPPQTGYNRGRPDQTSYNRGKPNQTGYNRGKPDQTGYNRGKPDQTGWKGQRDGQVQDGAFRRLANKRKNQESNTEGPPNKKQHINQPNKEKKERKEFVGMTAEKKKKQKFNKGQKKKRALSEILTK